MTSTAIARRVALLLAAASVLLALAVGAGIATAGTGQSPRDVSAAADPTEAAAPNHPNDRRNGRLDRV